MDPAKIRSLAQAILAELDGGSPTPPPPQPTGNTIIVPIASNLQNVHDNAPDGTVIQLSPGIYTGTLVNAKRLKWTPVVSIPLGRRTRDFAPVTLTSAGQTLTNQATDALFAGLCFKSTDSGQTIVMDIGTRFMADRVLILGDENAGQHRGFCPHGHDALLVDSYIDDCWLPKRDAAAVGCWDGTDGLTIENSYLGGGAQSLLVGGADPSSQDRIPKRIMVRKSTLSKNPAWYAKGAQIKCAAELKDSEDVTFIDCVLEYAGVQGGSTGYIVQLTPRNQGNTAPYTHVLRTRFERCLLRYGANGINILGTDDEIDRGTGVRKVSGPLDTLAIVNVKITNLDAHDPRWPENGRVLTMSRGAKNVTIDGFTAEGVNLSAGVYMTPNPAPVNLKMNNMKLPAAHYDVKIDGGGQGWAELKKLPDALITVTPTDAGAVGVPS